MHDGLDVTRFRHDKEKPRPMPSQIAVPDVTVRDVGPNHRRYTTQGGCQIVPHGQECYEINRDPVVEATLVGRLPHDAAELHAAIRRIPGVLAVDITPTQVAVQKDDTCDWRTVNRTVNAALKKHFRWETTATLVRSQGTR